jgi:plasmid stabilization system protein ParE
MRVRYSRRAVSDLVGIAEYIRERNSKAAAAVEKRILMSIEQLAIFPFIARAADESGIRTLPIVRYPSALTRSGPG